MYGDFSTAAELELFLNGPPALNRSRLFIVEDISPDVVELLGSHLDVDPAFFVSHIWALNWYSSHPTPSTVPHRDSMRYEQSFVQFRYMEARTVLGENAEFEGVKRVSAWDSHTLRKITVAKLDSTLQLMGWARRHITIWMNPVDKCHWTGKAHVMCSDQCRYNSS